MRKKVIAFLLLFALTAVSLAGCGKQEETDKKKDTTADAGGQSSDQADSEQKGSESSNKADLQQGDQEQADPDGQAPEEGSSAQTNPYTFPLAEKAELSVWLAWGNDYIEDPNDLISIQEFEKNTNVHINWVYVGSTEASEKFGLMMASGNYPDIIRGADAYYTGGVATAVQDGVFVELTDYIDTYMPNYRALRESNPEIKRATTTDDGRVVAVYTLACDDKEVTGEAQWVGMAVRRDWLEDVNQEVPITIEDWHTMLTAFKEEKGCQAPLLIAGDGVDLPGHFLSAYGVGPEFYRMDGQVHYGPAEEGYREYLELFHTWYEEGLIDKNFVTNDAAMNPPFDVIGTGGAGATCMIWPFTTDYFHTMGYNDEEDFYMVGVPSPVLTEGDTAYNFFNTRAITKETVCVSNNCKDVGLALSWIDYLYSDEGYYLNNYGVENDTYVINADGIPEFTENVTNDPEHAGLEKLAFYTLSQSSFGKYNWTLMGKAWSGTDQLLCEEVWDLDSDERQLPPSMSMTEEESYQYASIYTDIKTLVDEMTVKFITGTEALSGYDTFVQNLYEHGLQTCIDIQQAAYERYMHR